MRPRPRVRRTHPPKTASSSRRRGDRRECRHGIRATRPGSPSAHPFSNFLSSHHGFEVDRRNGTPVGIGIVRNAFEAFAPDDEQKTVACELFDVAEKVGVIFRIDYQWATDTMNCVPSVAKPCEGGTGFSSTFPTPFSDVSLTSPPLGGVFGIILRVRVTD